jgi:hypothetical protein
VLAGTVAADAIIGRRRPWAGAQTSL